MAFTRRRFLTGSLALAATARAAPPSAGGGPAGGSPDIVDVAGKDMKAMVRAAVDALGGIRSFVRPGDYVVLKPNAGFANPPAWATTTSPELVAAVAALCVEAKAKHVVVVEFPQGKAPERCVERCGLSGALAAVPQVKLKLLGPDDFVSVSVPGAVELKSVEVAKALQSADVFINLPIGKSHSDAGVSFGLKNHMGLIKDRRAFHTQYNLHQAVADLGRVVKPHLTILDATRVLLTNGPVGPGDVATPGRLVAGRNVTSVDAYALTVAPFNNKQMRVADARHIELAGQAGLGETDLGALAVKKLDAA